MCAHVCVSLTMPATVPRISARLATLSPLAVMSARLFCTHKTKHIHTKGPARSGRLTNESQFVPLALAAYPKAVLLRYHDKSMRAHAPAMRRSCIWVRVWHWLPLLRDSWLGLLYTLGEETPARIHTGTRKHTYTVIALRNRQV